MHAFIPLVAPALRTAADRAADLAGFVDFLVREADVGGGGLICFRSGIRTAISRADYFAPFLRGVVFVRQTALR